MSLVSELKVCEFTPFMNSLLPTYTQKNLNLATIHMHERSDNDTSLLIKSEN